MTTRRSKYFRHPKFARSDGFLGVTPGITTELLLDAYTHGIFPWSDRPACWYSPNPRSIFDLETIALPKRLERLVRQGKYQVCFDRAFREVMEGCRQHHRQAWISPSMIEAYVTFHQQGYAHSVEAWQDGVLMGGLYGVQIGGFFAGESMFYRQSDASKVAFAALVERLKNLGIRLFDSQVLTEHTARLGAFEIPRADYLERLAIALQAPWTPARWDKE